MKKNLLILSPFFFIVLFACSKSSSGVTTDCSTAATSFSTNVNPIIQSSCATNIGCHASGSNNGPGALTTYTEIFNARTQIRAAVSSGLMPQNATLTSAQKNSIVCWIDNGAQNN